MKSNRLFNKICIVGVGLIGGSLGMAIKKRKLARLVVGVVRSDRTAKEAMQKGALDVALKDLREGVSGADLIILCAPVMKIAEHLQKIRRFVRPGALVMDVGSTKELIDKTARQYAGRGRFVGCHPIAGSEKYGVQNARADLFKGSICFLTSGHAKAQKFWHSVGARPVVIDAKRHDDWAAQASHLPHLLSFTLFQNFPKNKRLVANPSIQDFARLGQSPPNVWADIFLSNRQFILKHIHQFQSDLNRFERALNAGNVAQIVKFISRANKNTQ